MARPAAWLLGLAASLAWMAGAWADTVCPGLRLPVLTPALTSEPYVILELDGRTGPWLLDFGATATTVSARVWSPPASGEPLLLAGFSLPGVPPGPRPYPVAVGGGPRAGIGLPHGIVGTDLLKEVTTELHFENANDRFVVLSTGCDLRVAAERGFRRADQANAFSATPAAHAAGRPNVPVVVIELEERSLDLARPSLTEPRRGGRVPAQLDTGYADTYWPYSVDINEPYLRELRALVPSLVRVGLVPVGGCGGEDSLREVYVAPGWRLNVVTDDPTPRRLPFDGFYFVVKPTQTRCGGIGPMPNPAAQLGSTFLRAFGTMIFAPSRSELWIRP